MAFQKPKITQEDLPKILFQVIQVLHHFILLGGAGEPILPKGFSKKQQELSGFLNPAQAGPLSLVVRAYKLLTQHFFLASTHMLRCHYLQRLDTLINIIQNSGFSLLVIQNNISKAKTMARQKHGKKLKPITISVFHQLFNNLSYNTIASQAIINILSQRGTSPPPNHTYPNIPTNQQTPSQTNHSNTQSFITPRRTVRAHQGQTEPPINTQNRFSVLSDTQASISGQKPIPPTNSPKQTKPQTYSPTTNSPKPTKLTPSTTNKSPSAPKPPKNPQTGPTSSTGMAPKPRDPVPSAQKISGPHEDSNRAVTSNSKPKVTTPLKVGKPGQSSLSSLNSQLSNTTTNIFKTLSNLPRSVLCHVQNQPLDVKGPGSVLSNFHSCQIDYKGRIFSSTEQAYQYTKAKFLRDDHMAHLIMKEKNVRKIKSMGNELNKKHYTREWDSAKLNIMREIILDRAKQSPNFRETLLNTYPDPITHSPMDKFWGTSYMSRGKVHPAGDNFAQILMQVRYHLANLQGLISNAPSNSSTISLSNNSTLSNSSISNPSNTTTVPNSPTSHPSNTSTLPNSSTSNPSNSPTLPNSSISNPSTQSQLGQYKS